MIRYNESTKTITLVSLETNLEFCSKPIIQEEYIYFIHPYEWECKGDLIKMRLSDGTIVKKLSVDSPNETFKHIFLNKDNIYSIIGEVYGTVSKGGNLYICDKELENLKLLKEFNNEIQITRIADVDANEIILEGIRYETQDYNEFSDIKLKVNI